MKRTDQEFMELFRLHPQDAMEALIEQYTGLVWKISSDYLNNTEDIKECVNDTFAAFYQQRADFHPSKGTLSSYLCAIAKHKAIRRYHTNRPEQYSESFEAIQYADPSDETDTAEWRLTLEQAFHILSSDEFRLIHMKYYEDMSIKEIADALNIPYETVKKRHQRSIGKLKKALAGLLILTLIGVLAACAYMVLRYFGVVPGYGINQNETAAVYVLEECVTGNKDTDGTGEIREYIVEDAYFLNDLFQITLTISQEPPSLLTMYGDDVLTIDGITYTAIQQTSVKLSETSDRITVEYHDVLPPPRDVTRMEISFCYDGVPLDFTMIPISEKDTEEFSTAMINGRGLLAIPKQIYGNLVIELHPLNQEPIQILPSLVHSLYGDTNADSTPVTLTDSAGTILVGTCIGYSPVSSAAFYNWNFGSVSPGTYTLHVPYLCETIELPDDFSIEVNVNGFDTEMLYEIPGGTVRIADCRPISADELPNTDEMTRFALPDTDYWLITLELHSDRGEFQILGLNLRAEAKFESESESNAKHEPAKSADIGIGTVMPTEHGQISYLLSVPSNKEALSSFLLTPSDSMMGPMLYRRWNQAFELTIHVPESET